jgi:hypothetical protein
MSPRSEIGETYFCGIGVTLTHSNLSDSDFESLIFS